MARGRGRRGSWNSRPVGSGGHGSRKHGLEYWARVWMTENFDYDLWVEFLESYSPQGSDSDSLFEAADEMYDVADDWESVASLMGGTVFLDKCEELAMRIVQQAMMMGQMYEAQAWAALFAEMAF